MKIERLRNKKSKLIFLCGFLVVVVLLVTVVIKGSKAKYRSSQIIPLINTKVKNNVPSFTTMGIYLETNRDTAGAEEKGGKYYKKQESNITMPSAKYVINETNSYCEKFNSSKNISEQDNNVKFFTNEYGQHIMYGLSKGDKCYIYFDNGLVTVKNLLTYWGYPDINKITERTDWGAVRTDTGNKVYKAEDNDGWSYYLVGNPENNWVKFGGYYWRIVRINGDGSLRMIYSGTETSGPATSGRYTVLTNAEDSRIPVEGGIKYAGVSYVKNPIEFVGYKRTEGVHRGNSEPSNAYEIANSFYSRIGTETERDYIDKNAGFCNDRSISFGSGIGEPSATRFKAYDRLESGTPTLKCESVDDLFTSNAATKGNKALANPIGLITGDEVKFGGLFWHVVTNANMYSSNIEYWTMTPAGNDSFTLIIRVSNFIQGGWIFGVAPNIRPVINLVKDITFSKGNGSISSPFEI